MKKYKLIKEYPGGPPLGFVLNTDIKLSTTWCWYMAGFNPATFPENWEEIIEKEYEILSFKQNSGIKELWLNDGRGWARTNYNTGKRYTRPYSTEEILEHKMYSIYSVKRLSDGEIFTVGDKVSLQGIDNYSNIITLTVYGNNISINGYINSIQYYKKQKQLLFTTEDDVDIFDGDNYFVVDTNRYINCGVYEASSTTTNLFRSPNYLRFSTIDATKEYIFNNNPCLSLNDIKKHTQSWWQALDNLVKTRLNL